MLFDSGVVTTFVEAFGPYGKQHIRMALGAEKATPDEALKRVKNRIWSRAFKSTSEGVSWSGLNTYYLSRIY